MAEGCVMVASGAKGSFPLSTDDATKPKNIIALSNPHTKTTGFQGTRMYMPEPPGTKSGSRLPLLYCEKNRLFVNIVPEFLRSGVCKGEGQQRQERRVAPPEAGGPGSGSNRTPSRKALFP